MAQLFFGSLGELIGVVIQFPFDPICPEQLNWVRGSDRAVPAAKIVG